MVGHAIHNDFKALKYFHPKSVTRDTSKIPLLNRKAGFPENESASLKRLTKQLLHKDIQVPSASGTGPQAPATPVLSHAPGCAGSPKNLGPGPRLLSSLLPVLCLVTSPS